MVRLVCGCGVIVAHDVANVVETERNRSPAPIWNELQEWKMGKEALPIMWNNDWKHGLLFQRMFS